MQQQGSLDANVVPERGFGPVLDVWSGHLLHLCFQNCNAGDELFVRVADRQSLLNLRVDKCKPCMSVKFMSEKLITKPQGRCRCLRIQLALRQDMLGSPLLRQDKLNSPFGMVLVGCLVLAELRISTTLDDFGLHFQSDAILGSKIDQLSLL